MCRDSVPSVSVLMGTRYVRADTSLLHRAVDSILAQTYADFEFLICDDGSTSAAKALLERVASEDKRVLLVRNPKCLDLASKLNLCLAEARSELIARMDDDDRSSSERLEKQIAYLSDHPDLSFVGCNVRLVRSGAYFEDRCLPERPQVEDFYFVQPYIHPTLVFRKKALQLVGGYSESKECVLCEDYDLLLRLYEHGCVGGNLQEALLDYTVSESSTGTRKMRHRMNEVKTRYRRFKALGRLPEAWPYVVKPIAAGLMPHALLERMREKWTYGNAHS